MRQTVTGEDQGFMNPKDKPRVILTDPAPMVNGSLEDLLKLPRFC
jgi:hypothetical protein